MKLDFLEISDEVVQGGELEIECLNGRSYCFIDADDAVKLISHLEKVFNLTGARRPCNDKT